MQYIYCDKIFESGAITRHATPWLLATPLTHMHLYTSLGVHMHVRTMHTHTCTHMHAFKHMHALHTHVQYSQFL